MSTFSLPTDPVGIVCLKAIRDCIAIRGEALQYQAGGIPAAPVELWGVWREDSALQAARPGAQACVYLCLPDMPADPAKGDLILKNGHTYSVMDAEVDGRGGVRLYARLTP
jgi:hypothetical protein